MIRFHNRIVDTLPSSVPPSQRFAKARELAVKHYQWMIKTDYLARICQQGILNDVFNNGRKVFEKNALPTDVPTMPIEFSVAGFRLGHSMIRREPTTGTRLRLRRRDPRLAVHLLGHGRRPRRPAAARGELDRRLPPALRLR